MGWACGKGRDLHTDGEEVSLPKDKNLFPQTPGLTSSDGGSADAGLLDAGRPADGGTDAGVPDAGVSPIFQPGFHQALRSVVRTSQLTTFRFKAPVGRAGARIRFAFLAAAPGLVLSRANVARAGSHGALASSPVPIAFLGSRAVEIAANQRAWSDPVDFQVGRGEQLYVSFEVEGALAASTIGAFPESYAREGSFSESAQPFGGGEHPRAAGLTSIEVEGEPGRAALALGNSITEGYVVSQVAAGSEVADGFLLPMDNVQNAWPSVAARALGIPIANAGISGQGVQDALDHLQQDVLALHGVTDCFVLIGTNDLWGMDANQITSRLGILVNDLRPHCRVWLGTLVPKERTSSGDYEVVRSRRAQVNAWIRDHDRVVDFELALRAEADPDHFRPGLGEDGIHPSVLGHEVMGAQATSSFRSVP